MVADVELEEIPVTLFVASRVPFICVCAGKAKKNHSHAFYNILKQWLMYMHARVHVHVLVLVACVCMCVDVFHCTWMWEHAYYNYYVFFLIDYIL